MKIAYIVDSLHNAAGMERILCLKANSLCSIYNITFIIRNQENKKPYYPLKDEIRLIDMGFTFPIEYRKELTLFLTEEKFDIVISTGGWEFYFLYKIKDGSKKIFEFHFSFYISKVWFDTANRGLSAKIKAYIQTIRRAIIARHYDQVVVLTTADASRWKWFCKNVVVMPNPLTIATDKTSICENKQVIAVGRLNRQKGFDYLIEAWKLVHCQHPDWILKIYGEGDLHSFLQSQINIYRLQNSVFLEGNTSHIIEKYLESSIFVLSSRAEGLPLVCLEALACGLPIVSFKLIGIEDLIKNEENGYLIKKVGDTQNMANAICKLIKHDTLRKRLGKNSLEIAKRYNVETIIEQWKELFNRQLN
ncbi:glycosyltransferase family 4 protein [Hoylesella saccharolytica]|jgi:glycosyltransferase, group 1 family|uniref:glycosyltransferase family 4 protein n=1 Tax=Hoylesella saccharolytica TaxID=633701 RepID=UPI000472B996|nr:glycosyltransferase family 4 protein [Hoylesella saccharolytica]